MRFSVIALMGRERFVQSFLPSFGHLSLIGLLHTVTCIFAQQASDLIHATLGSSLLSWYLLHCTFASSS